MRFVRLNAINEKLLYWRQRKAESYAAWVEAAKHRDASVEWDRYMFDVCLVQKLNQMLADERDAPTAFDGVKDMLWRWLWLWWAKRCMTPDKPVRP